MWIFDVELSHQWFYSGYETDLEDFSDNGQGIKLLIWVNRNYRKILIY